jgi:homoserine kinase type II
VPDHESLLGEVPAVLRAWSLDGQVEALPVAKGTLNWNFDVKANGERYFLRCCRSNLETERILGEHALVQWIANHDIPAPKPLPTAGGTTLVEHEGNRWALFRWMPGSTIERGRLSPEQARALGEMHGRTQNALASHPESRGAQISMRWSGQQSLDLLNGLVEVSKERREESWITEGISRQRDLLESIDVLAPEHFASLPCQLLHGDFHDQQVLFDHNRVTAVVDWEVWHSDPRAWELVRSLAFSRILDSPRLEDYLTGYRDHVRLGVDEVHLALKLWFQSRLVGVWAWWAYLMEGNERVKEFFPSMIAELKHVADERWTSSTRERFITAAC